jgi:iron complex outermembrane recepter protein
LDKIMLMKFLLLTFLIAITSVGFTQETSIKGKIFVTVNNEQSQPLEGATVQLLGKKDSALIKTALTDKLGNAELDDVIPGSYLLEVSMVNYASVYSQSIIISAAQTVVSVANISLKMQTGKMKEVTVTTRKPFIQKLADRIVVNVENSIINAGSSAYDVLERSPGVTIDQQTDAIGLRGKQGVIIMIDGRITPLSGASLTSYLRGLPSSAIERIDIITNPSARYDAAGNSGIIDIRMKKDQRFGANGTFTAGYGQGYYPKTNAGATFNYRNKKVNLFANYNYSYRKILNHLFLDRNFYQNGNFKGEDLKDNFMKIPFSSHTARLGADFFPSKRTIVGFVINSNFNNVDQTNDNSAVVIDQQKNPSYTFKTHSNSKDVFNNSVANINFKHTFDSTGKELTADADYGVFDNTSLSTTATKYFDLNGSTFQPDYTLKGDQAGKLTIKTAKADFVSPLKKDAKFEAGIKASFVSSDNDVKYFNVSNGTPQVDRDKTNHFLYDENNNAGYINVSKQFKKFNIQAGLRGEQTRVKTYQVNGSISFDSSYFQLFPSAFFNYNVAKDKTIGVSVSRRIDRPSYNDLNPFLGLIDVSTYATGNPALLPQFTWSYEVSYTLKQLNFSFNYSHTKNNMTTVIVPFKDVFPNIPSGDNVTVQVPVNLSSSDYYGLSVAAPVRITNWWNMINNGNFYYRQYHGNLAKTPLNNGSPAARIISNNTFSFKKGWTTELNFNYLSRARNGYSVSKSQWGIGAGVQKNVLKNKGSLRFNITDIFWTNLPNSTITYANYIEKWHAVRDSRVANLTFTYRFGNNKIAAARRRSTASEEETRRAGN